MNTILILFTLVSATMLPADAQLKSLSPKAQQESQPRESLQLQLSETVIAAGEDLWFQALLSTDSSGRQTEAGPESKVVYVELLNSSRTVLQSIYSIKNGIAKGQIQVPDTLTGGWYQLRAYTQWMRNFGDYASQQIMIINPYEDQLSVQQPKSTSLFRDIAFFPEGGHYVEGLPNRMVLQLPEEVMMDSIASARIISLQDSLTIAEVALESGQGEFMISPEPDKAYMLEVYLSGGGLNARDTVREMLPKPQVQGTTLQAQSEADGFKVEIHHSKRAEYTLRLRDRNAILYTQQYDGDTFTSQLNTQPFPSGVLELSVLDKAQQVVAQRMVYHAASEESVEVDLNKNAYRPREELSAKLSVQGVEMPAIVAITVRKVNPLTNFLQEYQQISGMINPNVIPEDLNSAERSAWINQKLISRESPFLPMTNASAITYGREEESLTVSGKVKSLNEKNVGGRVAVLSVPGNSPYFEYAFIDSDGSFQIPIQENVVGKKDIVLQMADTSLQVAWTLDEKFMHENTYERETFPFVEEDILNEVRQSYTGRAQIHSQYGLFHTQDLQGAQDKQDFRFYGAPNFEIRLENYIELPNFVEVNRELMPGIRLRESRGVYTLDVFDIPSRTFLPGEPSVFLDGVLIHDLNYLVNLPPAKMELIETVNRRTYYGEYRFDGTIAIYTKEGGAYLAALSSSAKQEKVTLYTPSLAFSRTDSLQAHEPDFRTLLHWEPALKLGEEPYILTFSNADELGEFEIIVEGMTEGGKPVYGRKTYTVSLKSLP
ncbi:hypothetical protein OKW21_005512 [Catalinimonas alkaloidigena]|uniref:hypothetical protein n=1 Tax=Catalinimonas alkaloidigena TaxID=1075417 RepID=UPI002406B60C|nr:hypothetical protein [Catalinimonas alkaloidigena]MDF9800249.1 hypothetical protein [Catalinimonas alkaloidigena]